MRNHVVIASYHGRGLSLNMLVQAPHNMSYEWFVYVQCDEKCTNTPPIQTCARRKSCHVSYLPNVGRESRVYFHHILMMYHHLPPLLYFLQENEMPNLRLGMAPDINRYVLYPGPRSGDCAGGSACGSNQCWQQASLGPIANRIMQIVYRRRCHSNSFRCPLRASFVVRREGIQQHPISTYIALTRICENATWVETPHGCWSGMLYGNYAAHAFERLWNTLFESEHNRLV